VSHDCCKTKVREKKIEKKKMTKQITPLRVHNQECGSLSTRVSLKIIWLLPSNVLTTLSLDYSLSVLLKLNKQLKISRNNFPRTNQGISDLNTGNMAFFRLELEGIYGCLKFWKHRIVIFFFFFFFFSDQQLAF
jgi:hypothetical protein